MSNDFKDDEKRQVLIDEGNFVALKKTYINSTKENPNTSKFWDKSVSLGSRFEDADPMTKDRIKIVTKLINNDKKTILDLGLGYGYLEIELDNKRKDLELSGIDISKTAITLIKKKIKGTFKQGSISKIPFNKKFDVVIALEILEHISASDIFSVYKEIKKFIKKDSQLIISVPINEKYTNKHNPNRHLRRYTKKLIKTELQLAGFSVVKTKELFAFKKLYILKKIISNAVKNKWKPNVIIIEAKLS